MATRLSPADEAPFNIQIKNLADEELLDFWEETQQIESALRAEYQQTVVPVQDFWRWQERNCSSSTIRRS